MRIALFTGNYNYVREGANQALNRLVAHLEQHAGAAVRVYSPVTDTPAFEPAGDLVPVRSIALPVRSEFRLALGLPRATRRDLTRFAPDIIHVATPDILGTRAQTFALDRGTPLVVSLHTRFETYLGYYGLDWLRPVVDRHIHRFYRRADHVLAPTPGLVDEMRSLRGDDRVSLWSRGVDRDLFAPSQRSLEWRRTRGIADDRIVILFFGRLVLEKGVEEYVAILRELLSSHPVTPLVVGAGPAAEAFAALPSAVLTGHLDGQELAHAVASADIMLNPSTTEAFGNVVLEAMASGLPVVSADAPSASALIVEGETGHLCTPGDRRAYSDALVRLIADGDARRAMGAAARARSAAFSWHAASESVARLYRAILAPPRQAQPDGAAGSAMLAPAPSHP
ncbi:glycosyltransferase family 4 protein [Sphingopyxis sp. MC1]|uniref:glycosyltransferase family 4 protein n=1 Tax=Sphingopyxis sp. MC1 TaxID=1174684 RepID=UPI00039CCF6C|nr:glycosyltransferase family 1 protein [Sphingopyxis sp. MC1]